MRIYSQKSLTVFAGALPGPAPTDAYYPYEDDNPNIWPIHIDANEGNNLDDGSKGSPVRTIERAYQIAEAKRAEGFSPVVCGKRGDVYEYAAAMNLAGDGKSTQDPYRFDAWGDLNLP